jgi:hypothetical protein
MQIYPITIIVCKKNDTFLPIIERIWLIRSSKTFFSLRNDLRTVDLTFSNPNQTNY